MFCWISHNVLELFSSYLTLLSSSNKSSDFPRSKKESIEISKLVWTSPTRQSLFGKSLFDLTLLFAIAKSFFCSVWISLMTSLTCFEKRLPKQGNIRRILLIWKKEHQIYATEFILVNISKHVIMLLCSEAREMERKVGNWEQVCVSIEYTVWTHHSTIQGKHGHKRLY